MLIQEKISTAGVKLCLGRHIAIMTDISFKDFALYCKVPRTRKEIQDYFGLSPIESWHTVKRFAKYRSDIMVTVQRHLPGNPKVFKTRKVTLDEIELEK